MKNLCEELSPNRTFYQGIDIYAEDLLGQKENIKVDEIIIWDSAAEGTDSYKETDLVKNKCSPEELKYFSKYNREVPKDYSVFKNKWWNTYIYDATLISDLQIVIKYNGEYIRLRL